MSQATATVTVLAPVPSISISDAAVVEGDLGTANADFVVTLSSASTDTVTVDYATADQTALSLKQTTSRPVTHSCFCPARS